MTLLWAGSHYLPQYSSELPGAGFTTPRLDLTATTPERSANWTRDLIVRIEGPHLFKAAA